MGEPHISRRLRCSRLILSPQAIPKATRGNNNARGGIFGLFDQILQLCPTPLAHLIKTISQTVHVGRHMRFKDLSCHASKIDPELLVVGAIGNRKIRTHADQKLMQDQPLQRESDHLLGFCPAKVSRVSGILITH